MNFLIVVFVLCATKLFAEEAGFESTLPEEGMDTVDPSKLVRPACTGLEFSVIPEEGGYNEDGDRETVGEERNDEDGRESRISSDDAEDDADGSSSVFSAHTSRDSETHSQDNTENGDETEDEDDGETVVESTFVQEIIRNLDESLATPLEPWWREARQVKRASHDKRVRFAVDDALPIFQIGGAASGFSVYSKEKITFSLAGLHKDERDHFLRLIDYGGAMHGFTENNKVEICCSMARAPEELSLVYFSVLDYGGTLHTFTELNKLRIAKALIMEEPGSHIYNLFLNLSKRKHRATYTEPVTMFYIARKFSDYNGFSEFSRGLTKIDDREVLSRIGSAKASLRILYYPEVCRSIYSEAPSAKGFGF